MSLKGTALCASMIAMFALVATAQSQNSSSDQKSGQSGQSSQGSSTQAQSNQNTSSNTQAQTGSSQSGQASSNQGSTQGSATQGSTSRNSSTQGSSNTASSNQGTSASNNSQTQPDRNAQSNSSSNANSDRNANTNDRSSSRSGTADQRDAVDGQYRGRNSADRSNERNDRDVDNRSDRDRANNNDRSYLNRDRSDRDRDSDRDRSDRDRSDRSDRSNFNRDRDGSRDRDMGRDRDRGNRRGPDIGLWFNRGSRDGLVISDVSPRGPIARFGFREGDRIVSVNGHRVSGEDDFMRYVLHGDSDRVTVIVYRDGREQTIYVEPAVFNEDSEVAEVDPMERFGIILDDRYDDRIVVWRVIPRSPAYYAGFRAGDVITTFGDHPYHTRNEFEHSVTGWKAGDVNVQVRRGENTRKLSVDVPNNLNRSDRVAERQDRQMDRTDRRSDRSDDRNYNNQQNRGRSGIGSGILNRGR